MTEPVLFPIRLSHDLGMEEDKIAISLGIFDLMAVEVGMITPPFGLNIFVGNTMGRDMAMADTYRGVLPFVASDIVRYLVALFVRWTSLWASGL